ncbi:3,2-trans-enoyl-CoA isomerase [Trichomonascus vanleenenianus]|uniref:dodecenoyl-CoA isomerase n=1 Tax=Trichomonascus vanleenenianus TaxID=2268995 RepID=UPI003ECB823F
MSEKIIYEVKKKTAIITINLPTVYNALDQEGYALLNRYVQQAAKEKDTVATLIQSTGKFFSAGANVKKGKDSYPELPENASEEDSYYAAKRFYDAYFGARNFSLTETFLNHPKVLVVALNGPVIGLSAALVAIADFIYALDSTYLLTPFANLGLVAEGAASYTLTQRLGWTKANEALLMARPIRAKELQARGFINELYPVSKFASTEEFNAHVQNIIEDSLYHLHGPSLTGIKKLIRSQFEKNMTTANYNEVLGGVECFTGGEPQRRFGLIATKQLKHKM